MADIQYEVLAWRKNRDGKLIPVRCGYAKPREDGGFTAYLDAMPAPENGQWALTIAKKRKRPADAPQTTRASGGGLDDDIPW